MKFRPLLLILPLAVTMAGCAQRVAFYPEAGVDRSLLAHIPRDSGRRNLEVISIDGTPIKNTKAHVELLPGQHTLEVVYTPAKTLKSYPVRVTFPAQSGHSYVFSSKLLTGQTDSGGVWGGKYQVSVLDLNTAQEVGRSDGRSAGLDTIGELRPPAPGRDADYQ
jgi:hypothetical protein